MSAPRLRSRALVLAALIAIPATLPAQSSIFGVRGLGLPGRPYTPATRGTGGSFGLFDGESSLNPAALAFLNTATGSFMATPTWRHWESPGGTADLRETRFPLMAFGGPIPGSSIGLGISLGSYSDRDFRLTSVDTVMVRGVPAEVFDTTSSVGGLNELRFAAGAGLGSKTTVGAAIYWITGSNRLSAHRVFTDTIYVSVRQVAEASFQGFGMSLGLTHKVRPNLQVALFARADGSAQTEVDSADVGSVDLPYTFGVGAQLKPSPRLTVAIQSLYRTWSGANSDLQARGAPGAENTVELSLGGEFTRNVRKNGIFPIRVGVRYAQLPFLLTAGKQPSEFGISLGTGSRVANDRARIDLALERYWRSDSSDYSEKVFTFVIGVSVRPYGKR